MYTRRFPEFYIGGAAKCGTTTLGHILNTHEDIFVPRRDPMFFDFDDLHAHPHRFPEFKDEWVDHDLETNFDDYYDWFMSYYHEADEDQLWGEGAPSYLRSETACRRLAKYVPDAKLIFLLRDPVDRAYSFYWDKVRSSMTLYDFETTLKGSRDGSFSGSYYRQYLELYFDHFDESQIEVIIFEDFVKNMQRIVDEVCNFLGCTTSVIVENVDTHKNKKMLPSPPFLPLKYLANRLRAMGPTQTWLKRDMPNLRYTRAELYKKSSLTGIAGHITGAAVDKILKLLPSSDYPPMEPKTHRFLQWHFARKNRGLSDLIGRDVTRFWPYMID